MSSLPPCGTVLVQCVNEMGPLSGICHQCSWHGGPSTWKNMQRVEVKGSELCIRKPLSFCTIKGAEPLTIHFFRW